MRLLITGGRNYDNAACMHAILLRAWERSRIHDHELFVVLHGACGVSEGEPFDDERGMVAARLTGADGMAHRWVLWQQALAERECREATAPAFEAYPADWERYGRSAGPTRNSRMVGTRPDACVRFPGGRGTTDCAARARRSGIRVGTPIALSGGAWSVGWVRP